MPTLPGAGSAQPGSPSLPRRLPLRPRSGCRRMMPTAAAAAAAAADDDAAAAKEGATMERVSSNACRLSLRLHVGGDAERLLPSPSSRLLGCPRPLVLCRFPALRRVSHRCSRGPHSSFLPAAQPLSSSRSSLLLLRSAAAAAARTDAQQLRPPPTLSSPPPTRLTSLLPLCPILIMRLNDSHELSRIQYS